MLPTETPPCPAKLLQGGLLFLSPVPLFLTHVTPQILLPANPSSFLSHQQNPPPPTLGSLQVDRVSCEPRPVERRRVVS